MACSPTHSLPLKPDSVEYSPNSIFLLTVEYPNKTLDTDPTDEILRSSLNEATPGFSNVSSQEADGISIVETVDDSVLEPLISGHGAVQQIDISDKDPTSYPLLLLQNEDDQHQDMVSTNFEDSRSVFNNFLFASLQEAEKDLCSDKIADKTINSTADQLFQNLSSEQPQPVPSTDFDLDGHSSSDDEEIINKVIYDKPVTCRARATLPSKVLYIDCPSKERIKKNEYGVFVKQELPKRTLFGPMEGVLVEHNQPINSQELQLLVESEGVFKRLDVSNEKLSNWMRYVRPAPTAEEQNLRLYQHGRNLYFSTLRVIKINEELKVWYSSDYARIRNLPCFLKPKIRKKTVVVSQTDGNNILKLVDNIVEKKTETREWRCTRCNCSFQSATLLNLHVLTHAADNIETEGIFPTENTENLINEDQFIQQLETVEEPLLFCNECPKSFSCSAALASHAKTHAGTTKIFDCPICNQKFVKLLHLKEHIHSHSSNGQYSCPHCAKKFRTYRHIRHHIRTYHSKRKFECYICFKTFPTRNKLKMHKLSHSEHREFSCGVCSERFKRKDKLNDHMKRGHFNANGKPTAQKVKNKKIIPRKVVENSDYMDFIYKCHICIVGFKRRGMLVNHLANTHPDVSPESIPELNLPILRENKDYYCQYCDKKYKSSTKRKIHILKNHPGEKLPLNDRQVQAAKKTLPNRNNEGFSLIVGSVTADPQSCQWCHRQYASKAKLLQHQRKNHLNLLPKSLQVPKKANTANPEDDIESLRDDVGKVGSDLLFHNPLENNISEYESNDSRFFQEGEFIIDASSLRRAFKEEVFSSDVSPETLIELSQILDSRPDQYFKVYQSSSGIAFALPVEVWDPVSTCLTLSPTNTDAPPSLLS